MDPSDDPTRTEVLVAELKRRKVFRAVAFYGAAAFATLQGLDLLVPVLLLPGWIYRAAGILLLLGFPLVIAVAWAYERTPDGPRRTLPSSRDDLRAILALPRHVRWRSGLTALAGVVLLGFAAAWALHDREGEVPPVLLDSLAVLPFQNLSSEPGTEYLGEGLAEELLNLLARVDGLKVAPRTLSFAMGADPDTAGIGDHLGVAALLGGSVQKAANRVRVSVRLVRASDGTQVWAERYDRELTDIFAVQDDIARHVVAALTETIIPAPTGERARWDVDAYQLFLQARYHLNRRGGEDLLRSIELFEEALQLEPGLAPGHAGLAAAYALLGGYGPDDPENYAAALAAADQALSLDPELAIAWAVRGIIHWHRRLFLQSRDALQRALELGPDEPDILLWSANRAAFVGHVESARSYIERAYELDPTSTVINGWMGRIMYLSGDDVGAERFARQARTLGWDPADLDLCQLAVATNRLDDARQTCPQGNRDEIDPARPQEVERWLEQEAGLPLHVRLGVAFGLTDLVLDALASYAASPDESIGMFNPVWAPGGAPIRADSRFAEWTEAIGFVDLWNRIGWPDVCLAPSPEPFCPD